MAKSEVRFGCMHQLFVVLAFVKVSMFCAIIFEIE